MPLKHNIQRVLLIEDDKDDCEVFEWAIKDISDQVQLECCGECKNAFELITSFEPDIIFLDLNHNDRHGLDFLAELKQKAVNPPPVVIYSSYMKPNDLKLSADLGALIYFEKPHSYTGLVEGLKGILSNRWWEKLPFQPMLLRDGLYTPIVS